MSRQAGRIRQGARSPPLEYAVSGWAGAYSQRVRVLFMLMYGNLERLFSCWN